MEQVSTTKSFGGEQQVWTHDSASTGTPMTFAIYVPEHEEGAKMPVIWWLSGLTCTHENAMTKAHYQKACAEHGVVFVCPDTSPRGDDVPDDERYDFGKGAGFYVDATQEPWCEHYRMRSYVEDELPSLVMRHFPVDMARQGISGHSMGGHGALTIGLRNPDRFTSISAFSPIVAPTQVPWGEKALAGYLGEDRVAWREYDACALIADGARHGHVLIDQGTADNFLEEQLQTHRLAEECEAAEMPANIRMQEGYDHSYFFISTFIEDHVRFHAEQMFDK
ncbi:S-formylglutathione hydrolase [Aurantiacibacter sp. D1-12]|uniref:S-formylglutathione hydrolase n=1 Tax=Aurantiacibacter sp. D1-12 TaxID=2993658 RepID=UPI00237C85D5|nr:S-formylglutathione hydrolase [Aurantiacibacter sp. D1-12]MDE1467496.1 S-formylglutathione hydrolase [Aurantiacibacter sp. D1-12]